MCTVSSFPSFRLLPLSFLPFVFSLSLSLSLPHTLSFSFFLYLYTSLYILARSSTHALLNHPYTHIKQHTYARGHTIINTYNLTFMHAHTYTHTHVYTNHAYIHTHTHTRTYITHVHTHHMHARTRTYSHTHTYYVHDTFCTSKLFHKNLSIHATHNSYTHTYAYTRSRTRTNISTRARTHTHSHTHAYTSPPVRLSICSQYIIHRFLYPLLSISNQLLK